MALTLSDGIREATEAATGMAGGLPSALVSLAEWADGRSIDVLAEAMRVSHSRAVRVVDRLEAAGLAHREPDPSDGRRALVWLAPAGRELAEAALEQAHDLGRVSTGVAALQPGDSCADIVERADLART